MSFIPTLENMFLGTGEQSHCANNESENSQSSCRLLPQSSAATSTVAMTLSTSRRWASQTTHALRRLSEGLTVSSRETLAR